MPAAACSLRGYKAKSSDFNFKFEPLTDLQSGLQCCILQLKRLVSFDFSPVAILHCMWLQLTFILFIQDLCCCYFQCYDREWFELVLLFSIFITSFFSGIISFCLFSLLHFLFPINLYLFRFENSFQYHHEEKRECMII